MFARPHGYPRSFPAPQLASAMRDTYLGRKKRAPQTPATMEVALFWPFCFLNDGVS